MASCWSLGMEAMALLSIVNQFRIILANRIEVGVGGQFGDTGYFQSRIVLHDIAGGIGPGNQGVGLRIRPPP